MTLTGYTSHSVLFACPFDFLSNKTYKLLHVSNPCLSFLRMVFCLGHIQIIDFRQQQFHLRYVFYWLSIEEFLFGENYFLFALSLDICILACT